MLVASCSSRAEATEQKRSGQEILYALEPGWNLISLPSSDPTFSLGSLERSVGPAFAVETFEPPLLRSAQLGRVSTEGVGTTKADGRAPSAYWVYVKRPQNLRVQSEHGLHVASSSVGMAGWSVLHVFEKASHQDRNLERVLRWQANTERYVRVGLGETLEPGLAYLTKEATAQDTAWRPRPPRSLAVTHQGRTVHVSWRPPTALANGTPAPSGSKMLYRVYRSPSSKPNASFEVTTVDGLSFEDTVETFGVYRYWLTTVFLDNHGETRESKASAQATHPVEAQTPILPVGTFEAPELMTTGHQNVALLRTAISTHDAQTVVHMVTVARDRQGEGDRIAYLHSLRSGAPGSFVQSAKEGIAQSEPGGSITELTLDVSSQKIVVAWVEVRGEAKARARIRSKVATFATPDDLGRLRFEEASWSGAESPDGKRDLRTAIDAEGHIHIV